MFLNFKDLSHLFQKHVRFSSGSFQTGVLGQALQYKVLLAGAMCKLCSKLKQDWQEGIFWRLCSVVQKQQHWEVQSHLSSFQSHFRIVYYRLEHALCSLSPCQYSKVDLDVLGSNFVVPSSAMQCFVSTSQYCFALKNWHEALSSTSLYTNTPAPAQGTYHDQQKPRLKRVGKSSENATTSLYYKACTAAANILQRHRDLAMNSLFVHHRIFIVNFEFHTFSHSVLSLTSDNEPA